MANASQPSAPAPRRYTPADPRALPLATDIDRRSCNRVVPLRVMCLGISRTGTCSLRQALLDLGYEDVYHYSAVLQENPRDALMWVEAMQAKFEGKGEPFTRKDWDQLLGHCEAITDNPCILFYRELLEAYPDSLVVLTIRDSAEQWWSSMSKTIVPFMDNVIPRTFAGQLIGWFFGLFQPRQSEAEQALNRVFLFQDQNTPYFTNDASKAIGFYNWYNAEIQRLVPPERLLILNVKQGWKPLCTFLGKEVPSWEFPRGNDNVTFNRNVAKMQNLIFSQILGNMAKTFGGAALLGVAAWTWRRMRY